MRSKRMIGLVTGILAVALIVATGATLAAVRAQSPSEKTPEEIGAFFVPTYGVVQPATFQSTKSRSEAETVAVNAFLEHFGYPVEMGIEENLEIESAQGLFSGAKDGFSKDGTWNIHNREVWVVVLHDLPVGLPCGPRPGSWWSETRFV